MGSWNIDVVDTCLFWIIHSLQYVHLIQVILSDGDLSTLSNMKINLELNQLSAETNVLERFGEDRNTVSSSFWSFILDTTLTANFSKELCLFYAYFILVLLFNVNMPNAIIQKQWNNYWNSASVYQKDEVVKWSQRLWFPRCLVWLGDPRDYDPPVTWLIVSWLK